MSQMPEARRVRQHPVGDRLTGAESLIMKSMAARRRARRARRSRRTSSAAGRLRRRRGRAAPRWTRARTRSPSRRGTARMEMPEVAAPPVVSGFGFFSARYVAFTQRTRPSTSTSAQWPVRWPVTASLVAKSTTRNFGRLLAGPAHTFSGAVANMCRTACGSRVTWARGRAVAGPVGPPRSRASSALRSARLIAGARSAQVDAASRDRSRAGAGDPGDDDACRHRRASAAGVRSRRKTTVRGSGQKPDGAQ